MDSSWLACLGSREDSNKQDLLTKNELSLSIHKMGEGWANVRIKLIYGNCCHILLPYIMYIYCVHQLLGLI